MAGDPILTEQSIGGKLCLRVKLVSSMAVIPVSHLTVPNL